MTDQPTLPAPALSDPAPHPPRKPISGPSYRDFIWSFLTKKEARNYLEIGVRYGETLAGVTVDSIGIDPKLNFRVNPIGRKQRLHLYQMTSDVYFRDHDPRVEFGRPVDVAFLDGLHLFEYLLRDFMNTERFCDRNSVIMLDDCLPLNIEMTERVHNEAARKDIPIAGWWTGDVWKVVSILRKYRPDLRIVPVDVIPTGSVLVCNLDPASTVISDNYFAIVDEFAGQTFTDETFDAYWALNWPKPAAELLADFDLSLFVRP